MKRWIFEHRFALADTFARLAREPLSTALNILVVGIALLLPLLGALILWNLKPLTEHLATSPEISIFLSFGTSRADALSMGETLKSLPGVRGARFVPREDALDELKKRPGVSEVLSVLNRNPLPDGWVLSLAADEVGSPSAVALQEQLAARIRAMPHVDRVQIDSAWVGRLEALMRLLRISLVLAAATFFAAVIAVIFNTIRLQVLRCREEIEIARFVGATDRFIRRPFYYMGSLQGALGALVALAVVALLLVPLNAALDPFAALYDSTFRFALPPILPCLGVVVVGAALGWMGAVLSMGRHLGDPAGR